MTAQPRRRTIDPVLVAQTFYALRATSPSKSAALAATGRTYGRSRQWAAKVVDTYEARKQPAPPDSDIMSRRTCNERLQLQEIELLERYLWATPGLTLDIIAQEQERALFFAMAGWHAVFWTSLMVAVKSVLLAAPLLICCAVFGVVLWRGKRHMPL